MSDEEIRELIQEVEQHADCDHPRRALQFCVDCGASVTDDEWSGE